MSYQPIGHYPAKPCRRCRAQFTPKAANGKDCEKKECKSTSQKERQAKAKQNATLTKHPVSR